MTLLSGFLYLMLILGGMAIGLIILDLNRAEDRAEQAINRLMAQAGPAANARLSSAVSQSKPIYSEAVRIVSEKQSGADSSWAFLSIPLTTGTNLVKTASVSYDFATVPGWQAKNKEQTTDCLLLDTQRTDCCA